MTDKKQGEALEQLHSIKQLKSKTKHSKPINTLTENLLKEALEEEYFPEEEIKATTNTTQQYNPHLKYILFPNSYPKDYKPAPKDIFKVFCLSGSI